MKLRTKILIILVTFVFIPITGIFIYYDARSQANVRKQVSIMAVQSVEQTAIALNDRIRNIEKSLLASTNNEGILDMLLPSRYQSIGLGQIDQNTITKFFNSIIYSNDFIQAIRLDLFNPDENGIHQFMLFGYGAGSSYSYGRSATDTTSTRINSYFTSESFRAAENLPEFHYSMLYKKAVEANGDFVWGTNLIPDDNSLFVAKQISYLAFSEKIGVVTFVISPSLLTKLCNDTENIHQYIYDQNQNLLTGQLVETTNEIIQTGLSLASGTSTEKSDNIVVSQQLSNGWTYLHTVYIPSLLQDILKTRKNAVTVALVFLGFLVIFIVLMLRHLSKQLAFLLGKFEKVERGDMKISESLNTRDELGKLDMHFNQMVERLQNSIQTNFIAQLEKKEAQLEALKFQINPHFLYNTLNIISSIATVNKLKSISEICQNLSQLFRYNIGGDNNVRLSDEIKSVQIYIKLQQIQFKDPFNVFIEIGEGLENCSVLKFILQPIVENAIMHGFKTKDRVFVLEINVFADDETLVIEISDDGAGVDPEELKRIKSELSKDKINLPQYMGEASKHRSIGLYNVHDRLILLHGIESGLSIESVVGQGTTVTIRMPLKKD